MYLIAGLITQKLKNSKTSCLRAFAAIIRVIVMASNNNHHVTAQNGLAEFLYPLFWDYEPQTLELVKHAEVIIARVMERGDWAAMQWLRQTYSQERLAAFLEMRGKRRLPPRELNYWALICGIPAEQRQSWLKNLRETADVWRKRYAH